MIGPKQKIAFVCSGGAAKAGAFHLGVALALQERGFSFLGGQGTKPKTPKPLEISTYVGSSAGAIIATYLAAGYTLENIFNSFIVQKHRSSAAKEPGYLPNLTYQKMFRLRSALAKEQVGQFVLYRRLVSAITKGDWRALLQLRWLKITGLFSTAGIEQYLREEVLESNSFEDYAAELYIVASQLNDSKKVIFGKNRPSLVDDSLCHYESNVKISDACAASTAVPVVFAPYSIQHRGNHVTEYIDGEIRDTLSTHIAVDAGADLVIASYTHQPYHFQPAVGSLMNFGLPAILIQTLYLLIEQKISKEIAHQEAKKQAIDAVSKFCKSQRIAEKTRLKICQILETELHHRSGVDTIYIHPDPSDAKIFFGEHFTLSTKNLREITQCGFRAATEVLRKYEFSV